MTDKKISELPAAAAIAGTEEIPVVQSAATVKSTPAAIKTYMAATFATGPASSTDNAIARFDSTTGKLLQNSSATIADTGALSLTIEDAGTTTVLFPAKITRTSSGTPANGIGVGMQFEVETSAGNNEIGATLTAEVTDVTAASEDFALVAKTMVAGSTTLVEGGRFVGAQLMVPAGTNTAPGIAIGLANTGLYVSGATDLVYSLNNSPVFSYRNGSSALVVRGDVGQIGFVSTSNAATGTVDTTMARNAAGVIEINNGTPGTFRDLKLRALTATPDANTTAITVASHTHTTSNPAISVAQTWNDAAVTFTGLKANFTDTASAAGSLMLDLQVGGSSKFNINKAGQVNFAAGSITAPSLFLGTDTSIGWYQGGSSWLFTVAGSSKLYIGGFVSQSSGGTYCFSSTTAATGTTDAGIGRNAAGVVEVNNGLLGTYRDLIVRAQNIGAAEAAATSCTKKVISIASIADATATTVFTVTIPNAAHSASVEVALTGSLGAGGAIGANEATGTIKYLVSVARTAGVNAVATISTAFGSATSAVAGAATITVAGDLGAITGAVGASNTFTIRVTITKGSGASANHTCKATAEIINANATGISIA